MNIFSNILTITKREIAAYFNAAIAYIFIIVFVLLNGGLFMTQFFLIGRADMRPFFSTIPFLLAIFIPAVTMRQWAEEKRGNTLELLLTFPMPTYVLVLGKFLASLFFYLIALFATFSIPVMIIVLGNPDLGVIISGYVGAIFLGAFFLAVGIFVSGLCRDQIVAFILSMLICFGLHLLGTEFMAMSIDGWVPGIGTLLRRFIGSSLHFDAFAKGIIDSRDVLYFLIGTVLFVVLNAFWLDGRMRAGAKKVFTIATFICGGIFLLTNWLFAGIPLGRFDLTQAKVHTVSEATKGIIRELKSPVTAKLYISPVEKMPTGMKTLEQDVVDKLDELRVHSAGKFQYKIIHMEAANVVEGNADQSDTESLEEQLQRKGIQPFQVRAVESDEVAVRLIYASLGLSYKEKPEEIVPQLLPERLHDLEYTIASKVYRMTLDQTPKIAIVAPYTEQQISPEVQALLEQLGGQLPTDLKEDAYELLQMGLDFEGYETSRINLSEEEPLDPETNTLVLIEPKDLSERQRYEISRFVAGGGSAFIAVQNYDYQYAMRGRDLDIGPVDKKPRINSLLSQWGFEVDKNILVDEQHDMITLGGASMGPFQMSVPVKIPIQVLINSGGMNQDVSVTSRLSPIFYLWGTALKINQEKIKDLGLKVTTLLSSSSNSWTVPFKPNQLSPEDLVQKENSEEGPLPLAVLIEGQFKDVYEGKEVPLWSEPAPDDPEAASVEPEEASPIEPKPGKMILVGASSFLQKHLVQGGGNLNFFLNSVDAITLGDALVTIRSKQPVDRVMSRVSTATKVGWRFFVTLFVPLLIAFIGGARVFLRKKAKQDYLKSYSDV